MDNPEVENEKDKVGDRSDEGKTMQAWLAGIAIGALVLAAMIVSYEIGLNNADDTGPGPAPGPTAKAPKGEPAATGPGATLYVSTCGSCHTLAAADTAGTVGPNLDDLKPDADLVAAAIAGGGAGSGVMPANLLSGEEATQVADYVAASAGSSK